MTLCVAFSGRNPVDIGRRRPQYAAMYEWVHAIDAPLLILCGPDPQVVAANRRGRDLLDIDPAADLPQPLASLVTLVDPRQAQAAIASAIAEGWQGLFLHLRGEVTTRMVHCSLGRLPEGAYALTLRPEIAGSLQERLVEILDHFPVGIEIYDSELKGVLYNKMSDELFLYPERPILHHDDWWELGFPDEEERAAAHAEWLAKLQAARREAGRVQFSEWSVRCRDGNRRMVQFRYRWIGPYYVLALWDVTSQRETERELRHLAVSDPLTGLWNRRRFEEDVALALDAFNRQGRGFGLLLIDIDHFKTINDRFGHLSGDEVLRAVATRCRRQLRQADLLARIGGEEFAVLLPDMDEAEAERVGRRLLASIAATPVEVGGHRIAVTLSIGCVEPHPQEAAAGLFARADDALYQAKADGRNGLRRGSPAPPAAPAAGQPPLMPLT